MLHVFLQEHRDELVAHCRAKAAKRNSGMPSRSTYGISRFIDQLIEVFRLEQTPDALARHKAAGHGRPSLALVPADIAGIAAKHGSELQQQGLTVDQVVHDYGDLCQALTELAMQKNEAISVDEFHTFNRCLDDAIADAVTGFATAKAQPTAKPEVHAAARIEPPGERMRVLVETALVSFAAIKSGQVALQGATATVHENSLLELRELVDRTLGNTPRIADVKPRG
jgi:hypothetical protein